MITFTQGGQLRFVDPRTFGEMFVTEYDDIDEAGRRARAPRPRPARDRDVVGATSASMLAERKTKLKPLLMDQKFIAGIGNIYSDEILFEAGLALGPHERLARRSRRCAACTARSCETLQDAVKYRGSSLADEQYVDLFGKPGRVPGAPQGVRPRGRGVPALPPRRSTRARVLEPLDLLLRRLPGLNEPAEHPCACVSS